ncbi:MAG TPA: hypothetical protein VMM92_06830, partial [Thermoanaerobaculia bacterium]|nr:hypothetical protein [Thermoanaerobaculia bacterium]
MSERFRTVFGLAFSQTCKRPMVWVLLTILVLLTWGLSLGNVRISSGDASVGGKKAWLTSEFSVAFQLVIVVGLLDYFFLSIAAGTIILEDDEQRITELLGATPLSPAEYVWGKFLGVGAAFLGVLLCHLVMIILFNQFLPNASAADIRGPFSLASYLRPTLIFALPTLLFFAGVAFYLGERYRRPVLVFLLPVASFLLCAFFLWEWSPTWLDLRINRLLMFVDPTGFRWLNETWFKLDRGVDFYNHAHIRFDLPFLLNRLVLLLCGFGGVALAQRDLTRRARGLVAPEGGRRRRTERPASPAEVPVALPLEGRPDLGARIAGSGFVRGTVVVARAELRALFSQVGLYLFIPLILAQTLGSNLLALGAFDTELLLTPGLLAVRTMNTLTFLLVVLLLFYTVESLERER